MFNVFKLRSSVVMFNVVLNLRNGVVMAVNWRFELRLNVVSVVVRVGWVDFVRVRVIVWPFGDDVVLLGSRHREVHRLMLLVLVVVRVVLVTVGVLRGHVLVTCFLIVVRYLLFFLVLGLLFLWLLRLLNLLVFGLILRKVLEMHLLVELSRMMHEGQWGFDVMHWDCVMHRN